MNVAFSRDDGFDAAAVNFRLEDFFRERNAVYVE
jgi:hypothetical protein